MGEAFFIDSEANPPQLKKIYAPSRMRGFCSRPCTHALSALVLGKDLVLIEGKQDFRSFFSARLSIS